MSAAAVGISARVAGIVAVVARRQRSPTAARQPGPDAQAQPDKVVESHPVIAPDGDVSLATKSNGTLVLADSKVLSREHGLADQGVRPDTQLTWIKEEEKLFEKWRATRSHHGVLARLELELVCLEQSAIRLMGQLIGFVSRATIKLMQAISLVCLY